MFSSKSKGSRCGTIIMILCLVIIVVIPANIHAFSNIQKVNISQDFESVFIPFLEWSPKRFDFGNVSEGKKYHTSFEIWNSGSDSMEWTLDIRDSWVTVDPISGESSGEHDMINVTIDTTDLSFGSYEGNVFIHSQGDFIFFTTFIVVPQELSYNPFSFDFGRVLKDNMYSTTLSIWNNGSDYLQWYLVPSDPWISVQPDQGVSNGTIDTIQIQLDTKTLVDSQTHANISILSNAGHAKFLIDFTLNHKPLPPTLFGPLNGSVRNEHQFSIRGFDEDNDSLYFYIDWGDGSNTGWIGPYENFEEVIQSHRWTKSKTYEIQVKSKDEYDEESNWTKQSITLPYQYHLRFSSSLFDFIQKWYLLVFNENLIESRWSRC